MDSSEENTRVDGENDKENRPRQPRQPKTTDAQYKKMFDFMNENNEGLIVKDVQNVLWEQLAAKLNDIGPPYHTSIEWKKIWSGHKKRIRLDEVGVEQHKKRLCVGNKLDEPEKALDPITQVDRVIGLVVEEIVGSVVGSVEEVVDGGTVKEVVVAVGSVDGSEEISKSSESQLPMKIRHETNEHQIEKLIEKQSEVINNQSIVIGQNDTIIRKLEISNTLLEKIASKP